MVTNKVSADIGSKKPAPKRKPAPKKKPVAKKKPAPKKAAPKRKPVSSRGGGGGGGANTAQQIAKGGEVLSQGVLAKIPAAGLAGLGIWVLLILRFTIFYGLFETPDGL